MTKIKIDKNFNFHFVKTGKEIVPREIIAGEVLFEWQNHKISSAVSKVYDFYRPSAIIHDHTES